MPSLIQLDAQYTGFKDALKPSLLKHVNMPQKVNSVNGSIHALLRLSIEFDVSPHKMLFLSKSASLHERISLYCSCNTCLKSNLALSLICRISCFEYSQIRFLWCLMPLIKAEQTNNCSETSPRNVTF